MLALRTRISLTVCVALAALSADAQTNPAPPPCGPPPDPAHLALQFVGEQSNCTAFNGQCQRNEAITFTLRTFADRDAVTLTWTLRNFSTVELLPFQDLTFTGTSGSFTFRPARSQRYTLTGAGAPSQSGASVFIAVNHSRRHAARH